MKGRRRVDTASRSSGDPSVAPVSARGAPRRQLAELPAALTLVGVLSLTASVLSVGCDARRHAPERASAGAKSIPTAPAPAASSAPSRACPHGALPAGLRVRILDHGGRPICDARVEALKAGRQEVLWRQGCAYLGAFDAGLYRLTATRGGRVIARGSAVVVHDEQCGGPRETIEVTLNVRAPGG